MPSAIAERLLPLASFLTERRSLATAPRSGAAVPPSRNRLLAALGEEVLDALRPDLERVALRLGERLMELGQAAEHVYFPEGGLVSIGAGAGVGKEVETGLVGAEGLVGLPAILGLGASFQCATVQVEAGALRVPAEALRRVMAARPGAGELLLRYASSALIQGAHASACHAHHTIDQRLARWLSSARDRLEEADILVTHDQLARMLGVRRAGITVALHVLEGEGLLRSTRGRVAVRDEGRLRAAACGCYAAARAAQDGAGARVGAEPWGRADAMGGAMICEAVAQAL